jgi:hypothetical protein
MKTILALLTLLQSIPTANVDLNATGSNPSESRITPANASTLSLRCSVDVDGQIFAQPLYVPSLTVSSARHNVAVIATMNDSIYAVDAGSCAQLWHASLGTPWTNFAIPASDQWANVPNMGCFSTPAIDTGNNVIYAVCAVPAWTLFKVNLLTGATISHVAIAGQVVGTGDTGTGHPNCSYRGTPDTTSGPNLLFDTTGLVQRPGLRFFNGTVYVTFGGIGDECPYHGWMMTYNASLSQTGIWCSTPNGWGGASWSSAPPVDASGNIYVTTGNGTTYDGITTYTNSVVKLSPSGAVLSDWFEPANNVTINAADADVAANRFVLIPGTIYGVIAAKDFNVYVIDTTCMGHLQGSSGCTLQTFQTKVGGTGTNSSGSYGAAFMNGSLILPLTAGDIYSYVWGGSSFTTTPTFHNTTAFGFPGPAQMAGSCNGSTNCILWVVTAASSAFSSLRAGTVRALDPVTGSELWNSGSSLGNMTKFAAPTIAGGRVLVGTQGNQLQVFGLPFASQMRGSATMRGSAVMK